jgi:DNA end-binding protein Ku
MATAVHKGAISFGLVNIPVKLYTATKNTDIQFNQLHKKDHARIRYKKVCAHCDAEIRPEDIIRGFEYDKNKFIVVTDEDLEKIKTEKDRALEILLFTDLKNIRPIFFDRSYYAAPQTGGEKAFELLRQAMLKESKVAVAKSVLSNKETLIAIMPTEEGILVQTMYYDEEIKDMPVEYAKPKVSKEELAMAKTLISSMDKPFDAAAYHDEYQQRLRELIQNKIQGRKSSRRRKRRRRTSST